MEEIMCFVYTCRERLILCFYFSLFFFIFGDKKKNIEAAMEKIWDEYLLWLEKKYSEIWILNFSLSID